jgi:hypothetical protein
MKSIIRQVENEGKQRLDSFSRLTDSVTRFYALKLKDLAQVDSLKNQKIKSPISGNMSAAEKQGKVDEILSQAQNNTIKLQPRVYIQIASDEQREIAGRLQRALRDNEQRFIVPALDNVGGKANMPRRAEVRYYWDDDLANARIITTAMTQLGINTKEQPVRIPGNGRGTRPGHFEVWFAK